MAKDMYSDNVYAYALSKTISKVHPPLTVGLYSSCHSRIKMILKSIEDHMNNEAKKIEKRHEGRLKPRPLKGTIASIFSLMMRLLFYRPVWTEKNQKRECVRYVFVRFSAWHFTGSDMLWAGLVMHLCQSLQDSFGKLQLSLYRVAQHDPEKAAKRKKIENSSRDWRSKKICCCPLWVLVLLILMGTLFILIPIIIFGFFKQGDHIEGEKEVDQNNNYGVLEGFAIAALGVPAAGAVRFTFMLGKTLIFNQDFYIRRGLDNQKISQQLGLMHEVRKEMRLLSCFIHFMEIFERRKIRVVLEITNLDHCTADKIVGVLNAINILLSDEESPFISLIAVDPDVLTQQIDQVTACFTKKGKVYGFLDRIITLPFTIPPLCDASKCKVFCKIAYGQSETPAFSHDDMIATTESETCLSMEDDPLIKSHLIEDVQDIFALTTDILNETEVERLIQSSLKSVFLGSKSRLYTYISENTVSMRRISNSIRVSVLIMESFNIEVPPPERVAAWIVLLDRWPCRLSWVLQCMEDEQQIMQINENYFETAEIYLNKTLWDIFSEHRVELHVIGEEVEKFLERDDDPELFEMFLSKDFKFTVKEVAKFKLHTVNLDYSIKNEFARIRGSNRVNGTGKNIFNTLSSRTVSKMTVQDVCIEISRIKLPEKYNETVKQNHLNGLSLLLSDPADLRQVMQMSLGEWTAFKTHFLGVRSHNNPRHLKLALDVSPKNVFICPSSMGR